MPAECFLVKELKTDSGSEALKQPDVPTGSKAEDSNRDDIEKPHFEPCPSEAYKLKRASSL